jgi:hypothetical protein
MPFNLTKEYSYIPIGSDKLPSIPTSNLYRARSGAAETFFRAKEVGEYGNKISIQLETSVTETTKVTLTVSAPIHTTVPEFSGTNSGRISNIIITQFSRPQDIVITAISGTTFSVISNLGDLGTAESKKLFRHSDIAFTIISNTQFTIGDTFTLSIVDPTETYISLANENLNPEPIDPEAPVIPSPAYAELRLAVNTNSKLIEMPERGYDYVDLVGTDVRTGRNVRDIGTEAVDGPLITNVPKTFLSGGIGLPNIPTGIHTGPERTFVHINYGEQPNGEVSEINKIYEWAGSSQYNGHWGIYY